MPMPVKLGLAGDPAHYYLYLSVGSDAVEVDYLYYPKYQSDASWSWISLFLAGMGLKHGWQVCRNGVHGQGLLWVGIGFAITVLPLLIIGFSRRIFRSTTSRLLVCWRKAFTDPHFGIFKFHFKQRSPILCDTPTFVYHHVSVGYNGTINYSCIYRLLYQISINSIKVSM